MKPLIIALLPLLAAQPFTANAENYKTIPITENGTTTAYISVPSSYQCNVSLPDYPTAFCSAPGHKLYHLKDVPVIQGTIHPEQIVSKLLNEALSESPEARLLRRYQLPEITRYVQQQDSQLLFLNGQQVVTYAFDVEDPQSKEKSVTAITVRNVPNNGAPITLIRFFGVSKPSSSPDSYSEMRNELIRFAHSSRYDRGWVQSANRQHVQFLNNLRERQSAFASNQQRIHQSNMNALDSSFNSYMDRSAASYQSQKNYMSNSAASDQGYNQYINSIHERELLVDPNTGTRYEADGYYDYNYVNPNDSTMYYRTNDPLANPNINTNQGEYYNPLQQGQ